jgi:hypothetical protein
MDISTMQKREKTLTGLAFDVMSIVEIEMNFCRILDVI